MITTTEGYMKKLCDLYVTGEWLGYMTSFGSSCVSRLDGMKNFYT